VLFVLCISDEGRQLTIWR